MCHRPHTDNIHILTTFHTSRLFVGLIAETRLKSLLVDLKLERQERARESKNQQERERLYHCIMYRKMAKSQNFSFIYSQPSLKSPVSYLSCEIKSVFICINDYPRLSSSSDVQSERILPTLRNNAAAPDCWGAMFLLMLPPGLPN